MIDISNCQVLPDKTEGIYLKKWILYNDKKWLVKYNRVTKEWINEQKQKGYVAYLTAKFKNKVKLKKQKKLTDVDKEIMGIWLAEDMGLKAANAFMGLDQKEKCAVIKNFLGPNDSIVEFSIADIQKMKTTKSDPLAAGYEQVFNYFPTFAHITKSDLEKIKHDYINAILFSLFVANVDLHIHNINLIYNSKTKSYRFTPIFDQNHCLEFKDSQNDIIFAGYPKGTTEAVLKCLFINYENLCKKFITTLSKYDSFANVINKEEFNNIRPQIKAELIKDLEQRKQLILNIFNNLS